MFNVSSILAVFLLVGAALLGACNPVAQPASESGDALARAYIQADAEGERQVGLSYRLEPVRQGARHGLRVELAFRGKSAGTTRLLLPSSWASETRYFDAIEGLALLEPEGASLRPTERPDVMLVQHLPGARLRVSYTIWQDWQGPASERPYRPIFQPGYFHFVGTAAWVQPAYEDTAKVPVSMAWQGFPEDWELASSHGIATKAREQRFVTSPFALRQAIYVGGDFRLHRLEIDQAPVYVAVRGQWPFADEALLQLVGSSVDAGRDFWEDRDFPYFLLTLIPGQTPCCSYRGTALTNSFAMVAATNKAVDPAFAHLLTHELFHTWNGHKMAVAQPERLMYWFSEGVTNYYTRLLNLRAGILDLPAMVRDTNRMLYDYAVSQARAMPNDQLQEVYWSDPDARHISYLRGDLLAMNWNARIRAHSEGRRSLDDVMRALLHRAQKENIDITGEIVDDAVRRHLPQGIMADLARHVETGHPIEPEPGALGPCVQLTTRTTGLVEAGFDVQATRRQDNVVQGVVQDSAAWRAGLRDGQRIDAASLQLGARPPTPARLLVQDGQQSRELHYLPVREERSVALFELDEERYRADPETCLAWFGL